jgi:hypothetical protein
MTDKPTGGAGMMLRAWCVATSLFEVPEIYKVLTGAKLAGFQEGLVDTVSTRRLWVRTQPLILNVAAHRRSSHLVIAAELIAAGVDARAAGDQPAQPFQVSFLGCCVLAVCRGARG